MLKRIAIVTNDNLGKVAVAVQRASLPATFQREVYNKINSNLNVVDRKQLAKLVKSLFDNDYDLSTIGGILAGTLDAYPRLDYIEGKPGFYFTLNLHSVRVTPYDRGGCKFIDNPLNDPQIKGNLPQLTRWVQQFFAKAQALPHLTKYGISLTDMGPHPTSPMATMVTRGGRQSFHVRLMYPIKMSIDDPVQGTVDLSTL